MGYERYPRNTNPQGDYYGRNGEPDYAQDYGSGRYGSFTSARDYEAAGEIGDDNRRGYGQREYGNQRYSQREQQSSGRDYYGGRSSSGRYGQSSGGGRSQPDHGSYASDGHRWEDVGRYRHADDDNYVDPRPRQERGRDYGRQSQGDQNDRGFFARAEDEVRSWFGDEDAERRRERDARQDERDYRNRSSSDRDNDYHSWRSTQIAALDRDYDEYRRENQSRFHNEFSSWRTDRQGQRDSLNKVREHMDVVGSDGEHVGTVDKVRGDRILLTKSDPDAGGHHHSIPSRWIQSVDDNKVTLRKSAQEAKDHWRDEERNKAMLGHDEDRGGDGARDSQGRMLNRSFSGTY